MGTAEGGLWGAACRVKSGPEGAIAAEAGSPEGTGCWANSGTEAAAGAAGVADAVPQVGHCGSGYGFCSALAAWAAAGNGSGSGAASGSGNGPGAACAPGTPLGGRRPDVPEEPEGAA